MIANGSIIEGEVETVLFPVQLKLEKVQLFVTVLLCKRAKLEITV